jgi:hypothetical protein
VFGDGVPINLPAWVTAALVPLLRPVSAVWEWQAVTEWIALLPHPFRQKGESQWRPSGRRQSAVLAVASTAQVDQWGGAGLDANLFTVSSLHRTESLA